MRALLLVLALLPSILAPACASSAPLAPPPLARASDQADVLHGARVPDPYRWMEDDAGAGETRAWVEAQERWARAWLDAAPDHAGRLGRLREAAEVARTLAPIERGGRFFLPRVDAAVTRTTWLVREGWLGSERVLVDGDALFREGRTCDRRAWPSPDGTRLAIAEGTAGSSWREIRVLDVDSGRWLPDRVPGFVSGASTLVWHPSGSGFFHARFEPPRDAASTAPYSGQRVEYHALGAVTEVELVPPVERSTRLVLGGTDDGARLVLTVREAASGAEELRVADVAEPLGPWRPLVPHGPGSFSLAGSRGDELLFHTTRGAPNGKVIAVRATDPPGAPVELVPEREAAIDAWTSNAVRAVGDGLVVAYREDARLVPRLFDRSGAPRGELELPRLGSVWSGWSGRAGSAEAFYLLSGFVDPGTLYRLDAASGRSEPVLAPELPYDPDEFVTRLVHWSGPAGERLPMFLAHHRDTPPNGERPVLLYGYAFAGWSAAPWYRPHMAEWMRGGGTFALPALRGGGERGEAWHRAGVGRDRQNAIDDFVACARWLAASGLVRPERIAAETTSAGAAVVAAALLQAPDAFGAGILAHPLVDVLRYDRFTGGAAWRSELGSADDPDDFRALAAYAPLLAVRPGVRCPPLFVSPGELDQVTPPVHAYKLVAALQAAGARGPIVLRVARGAGHGYGADLEGSLENFADQLSFLERVLGP